MERRRGAAALALRPRDGIVENVERRQPRLAAAVIAAVRVDVEHPAARGAESRDVPERWRRLLLHEPQPLRSREHRARARVLLPSLGKEAADRVAPILAPQAHGRSIHRYGYLQQRLTRPGQGAVVAQTRRWS